MSKYYAVKNGRNPGVYESWDDCKAQTNGYSNAKFKSFESAEAANHYMNDSVSGNSSNYSSYRTDNNTPSTYSSGGSGNPFYATRYIDPPRNERRFEIYTDGACSNNGNGGAKAGIGVHFPDSPQHDISEPLSGRQTNNRAEIKSVVRALEKSKQMGRTAVTINTDSQFLYDSVNDWQHKWKRDGWKKSDGKDVINKDDFLELEEASKGMDIKYNKVAAHKGIPGNERADKLATTAIQSHSRY